MSADNGLDPINCFALVTYIPDPLGAFLDQLRRDLVPGCLPRAHVTILPPRPLQGEVSDTVEDLGRRIPDLPVFEIEARGVEVFATTGVIYIGIGTGRRDLQHMHALLNAGPLHFEEPFPYHPHITLAQDLKPEDFAAVCELARRRWTEFRGSRSLPVGTLTFVQNTLQNRWLDLARWTLGAVPSIP